LLREKKLWAIVATTASIVATTASIAKPKQLLLEVGDRLRYGCRNRLRYGCRNRFKYFGR